MTKRAREKAAREAARARRAEARRALAAGDEPPAVGVHATVVEEAGSRPETHAAGGQDIHEPADEGEQEAQAATAHVELKPSQAAKVHKRSTVVEISNTILDEIEI